MFPTIIAALSALILPCVPISTPQSCGLYSIRWTPFMINLLLVGSPAVTGLRPVAPPTRPQKNYHEISFEFPKDSARRREYSPQRSEQTDKHIRSRLIFERLRREERFSPRFSASASWVSQPKGEGRRLIVTFSFFSYAKP